MSGPQCCENPPTLSSSSGAGLVQKFGGLNCYISGPADSKSAVVLISDIFGYEASNLRKLADKVGAAGFYTVVPDFLHGDPYVPDQKPLPDWIKIHGTDQGFEDAKPVIEALKSKGVTKVGAAGFCWGAKVVVELAKYPYIHSGVLLHPSFVSLEDIQGVKVPLSILGAEIDKMSPPELVKQFESALKAKPEQSKANLSLIRRHSRRYQPFCKSQSSQAASLISRHSPTSRLNCTTRPCQPEPSSVPTALGYFASRVPSTQEQ